MLIKFLGRDRLVMAGLVILGFATVVAGFVSGRSTFQYALATDARQASTQWVKTVELRLSVTKQGAVRDFAGQSAVIAAPEKYASLTNNAALRASRPLTIAHSVNGESGLLAGIDLLFSGWIRKLTHLFDQENFVSQVRDFALLDSSGTVIVHSAGLERGSLQQLLTRSPYQSELHKAIGLRATRVIERTTVSKSVPSEYHKTLIMPLLEGDKVSRVYVLTIDQSSAATMSKVALVAASMMTSLLIVLGYSVPAAVAFRRIRERWKAEDQIRFLALHDPLTGLSNRVQLQTRLEQAIQRARRRGNVVGVMCVDLDRFKEVNDALGHKAGDQMLVEFASRLRQCVRETDVVARVGGDEFVVIAEELEQASDAIPVARRICQKLAETVEIEGHEIAISGSVGITFAPKEGSDVETLLNNADLALYRAKNDGRCTFRFFEPEMDEAIQSRRRLAAELRQALRAGGLHLNYQPHFDLKTGALTGYEALARWTHAEKGVIPPATFIPIAEESGLIGMLGEWVLETACEYARHWPEDTTLSINVSTAQFAAQNLAATVKAALARSGLAPERLLLEFTEELLIRKPGATEEALKQLTDMGVRLAIDNFGSGHSSLSFLTRLPVSKIKIDRSFVRRMGRDEEAGAIIKTIIGIGKSLDLTIVAEGVETEEQACRLRDAGCGEVQGFLYGRPQSEVGGDAAGTRLFQSDDGEQEDILDPVQLETDYPELPLPLLPADANTLSSALPGDPVHDEEIERFLQDEEDDRAQGADGQDQDTTVVTPFRSGQSRQAS